MELLGSVRRHAGEERAQPPLAMTQLRVVGARETRPQLLAYGVSDLREIEARADRRAPVDQMAQTQGLGGLGVDDPVGNDASTLLECGDRRCCTLAKETVVSGVEAQVRQRPLNLPDTTSRGTKSDAHGWNLPIRDSCCLLTPATWPSTVHRIMRILT